MGRSATLTCPESLLVIRPRHIARTGRLDRFLWQFMMDPARRSHASYARHRGHEQRGQRQWCVRALCTIGTHVYSTDFGQGSLLGLSREAHEDLAQRCSGCHYRVASELDTTDRLALIDANSNEFDFSRDHLPDTTKETTRNSISVPPRSETGDCCDSRPSPADAAVVQS